MDEAACAGVDPNIFFPSADEDGNTKAEALAICSVCRVAAECLEFALETNRSAKNDKGIWGGTTQKQRQAIRTARAVQSNHMADILPFKPKET